ncbi:MAG TPA: aminoacyl-tRNA hydrolase [Syntrophomonas sp.]|jgi:PTH1 family peptidyl-tRNA hydrolase|nr:aminoacyl-tRNA hydrolase [Syntrophomonas sp.]
MKVIVGLGNPGRKYSDTRHNIGFRVLEEIARRSSIEKEESRFNAIIGHIRIGGEKVLLVKPLTYMNLSGKTVQPLARWFKLNLSDLIIIYDDMDLPPGALRLRAQGGSGGHKGMASIIERLGTQEFARIRIGIGRPNNEAINWVLGRFSPSEQKLMEEVISQAVAAVECWIKQGIDQAMNEYN